MICSIPKSFLHCVFLKNILVVNYVPLVYGIPLITAKP